MRKQRQRAALVALLFGTFYFLTEGLSVLFHQGKPYLKFLKHVDLDLPIHWLFWLAEILGLYGPVYLIGVDLRTEPSSFVRFRPVALGTLIYIGMGYILGFLLPLADNPDQQRETDTRNIGTTENFSD
jgi:hypothetical protein